MLNGGMLRLPPIQKTKGQPWNAKGPPMSLPVMCCMDGQRVAPVIHRTVLMDCLEGLGFEELV